LYQVSKGSLARQIIESEDIDDVTSTSRQRCRRHAAAQGVDPILRSDDLIG
jgi:hypothetical protein